jgi:hypothetical protein
LAALNGEISFIEHQNDTEILASGDGLDQRSGFVEKRLRLAVQFAANPEIPISIASPICPWMTNGS